MAHFYAFGEVVLFSSTFLFFQVQTILFVERISYRVSQNYPNMQLFAIFPTALKPVMLWFPKFSELLIKSQS